MIETLTKIIHVHKRVQKLKRMGGVHKQESKL